MCTELNRYSIDPIWTRKIRTKVFKQYRDLTVIFFLFPLKMAVLKGCFVWQLKSWVQSFPDVKSKATSFRADQADFVNLAGVGRHCCKIKKKVNKCKAAFIDLFEIKGEVPRLRWSYFAGPFKMWRFSKKKKRLKSIL